MLEFVTRGAEATRARAARLATLLAAGDLVLLEGGLGAGKTVFVQGLARGLGLSATVKSPTFTLVHEYTAPAGHGRPGLAHLDLYRIPEGRDLTDLGLDELLARVPAAVEWGGRLADDFPDHIRVTLEGPDPARPPDERRIVITGQGGRGTALVRELGAAGEKRPR